MCTMEWFRATMRRESTKVWGGTRDSMTKITTLKNKRDQISPNAFMALLEGPPATRGWCFSPQHKAPQTLMPPGTLSCDNKYICIAQCSCQRDLFKLGATLTSGRSRGGQISPGACCHAPSRTGTIVAFSHIRTIKYHHTQLHPSS